jgi:5-methylcytosine-specific restriction endonuclease McrA
MNWQRTRLQVLERDNYTCQTCLDKPAEDVHHIISKRRGGMDVSNNLTSVCSKCHGLIELRQTITNKKVNFIWVKSNIHDRLKKHGKFGQSFQDILNSLMDIVEGKSEK